MNAHNHYSIIVAERWEAAVKNPSPEKWREVAQLAAHLADSIEHAEPDSMLIHAMRGIYQGAYQRMEVAA